MNREGPLLESLTRRLTETPPEFLAEPRIGRKGAVTVAAVVNDTLVALGQPALTRESAGVFQSGDANKDRNRLQVTLIACWLLYDEWFRNHPAAGARALDFLTDDVRALSGVTNAQKFISDPDRREEFARSALSAFDLRPQGETITQAQDRLTTLNAAERERVIRAARVAEERAQAVREAMAKKAAEEAAAKAYRE
jgi:hypothetical protein